MYIHIDIHTEREKEEEGWKETETEKIYQRNQNVMRLTTEFILLFS